MTNQPRDGIGRFSEHLHGEPGLNLSAGVESVPDLSGIAEADADTIREIARSTSDPLVKAELTSNPRIPDDVLEELADPSERVDVRLAVANTGYPGAADRAAKDPHPLVRASAYGSWDLSEENRKRLAEDPGVKKVLSALGG